MNVEELTPQLARTLGLSETKGIVVVQVENDTPAAEAGLRPGDFILELDQTPVRDLKEFQKKIQTYEKGETILFLIKRENATLYVTVTVPE